MIGLVLGSRYEIVEHIDSGGMAYIYRAVCKKTGSFVAIKILKEKFSENTEYVSRFKKEATAAFSLDHDHIVRVTDIGCDGGVYYMVMEFIEGVTLKSLIDNQRVLGEKEAVEYAIQICSALSSAHKRGIIHRDIKPHNILIDGANQAKVTDFGIAKSLSTKNETESLVIGSVYYISPEQARGENVDARTDIYSLGIMLYEMLTGELPYTGDKTVSVALKHINEQIIAPIQKNPALSASINKIILKATSKNKRDRYRSMDALRDDLVQSLVNPGGDFVDLHEPYLSPLGNRLHASRQFKIWKICVLAALITGVVVAAFFSAEAIHKAAMETKTVPEVTGISMDSAISQIEGASLQPSTVFEASETIPMGVVISQSPAPGSTAAKGDTVTLTVSSGPADVLMPNLFGVMLDDARILIGQMGLELESVTYDLVEGAMTGSVIAQSPEADSIVVSGDPVSLIVAGDITPSGAVPQLTGLTLTQAAALIYDTGFSTCYVYEQESDLPEGTVAAQSPEQGIQTPFSNEVTLWVSAFEDKPYSAMLMAQIDIIESDSTVRIIVEEVLDGRIVGFVHERQPDVGILQLDYRVYCLTGGVKTVRILVNGIEAYTGEIEAR